MNVSMFGQSYIQLFIRHPTIRHYIRPIRRTFTHLTIHKNFQPIYLPINHLHNQSYFKNLMQIKANKILIKQALRQVALCGTVVASFGTVTCCTVGYKDR